MTAFRNALRGAVGIVAVITTLQASAGGTAAGAGGGLADAIGDMADKQMDYERQRRLMLEQYELDMRRMKAEYEARSRRQAEEAAAARPDYAAQRQREAYAAAAARTEYEQRRAEAEALADARYTQTLQRIAAVDPDWQSIMRSPGFTRWLQQQDLQTRAIATPPLRAPDINIVLARYKRDVGYGAR